MSTLNRKNNLLGIKSPSKASLVRSKSTDQLTSTHQKAASKKNIMDKSSNGNDFSMSKVLHVSKPKSNKSLKCKTKSSNNKSVEQKTTTVTKKNKKAKKTSISDCKTVKKLRNIVNINLSEESFNSIESSKPLAIEYFLYQNTYVPI